MIEDDQNHLRIYYHKMVWIIFDHSSTTSEWRNVKVVDMSSNSNFQSGTCWSNIECKSECLHMGFQRVIHSLNVHMTVNCPVSRYLGSQRAPCHSLWHADLQEKIFCNSKLWICQGTTLLVCKSLLPFQSLELFEKRARDNQFRKASLAPFLNTLST